MGENVDNNTTAKKADSTLAAEDRDSTDSGDLPPHGPLRQWIVEHDDSWLFTIGYVGLALVLSIWISLFWLVVVVGVHFILECFRHKQIAPSRSNIALLAGWEVKLDIALILFALALTAYMDFLLGVAGLGGAARLGARGAARVGGWGRAIKATLLSLDDAAQVARMAISKRSSSSTTIRRQAEAADGASEGGLTEEHLGTGRSVLDWRGWNRGDYFVVGFAVICLSAIMIAPLVTPHTYPSLVDALLADLHPWPS